jgi:hypothetical protein
MYVCCVLWHAATLQMPVFERVSEFLSNKMTKICSISNLTEDQFSNNPRISYSVSAYSMQQQIFTFLRHNINEIVIQDTV